MILILFFASTSVFHFLPWAVYLRFILFLFFTNGFLVLVLSVLGICEGDPVLHSQILLLQGISFLCIRKKWGWVWKSWMPVKLCCKTVSGNQIISPIIHSLWVGGNCLTQICPSLGKKSYFKATHFFVSIKNAEILKDFIYNLNTT